MMTLQASLLHRPLIPQLHPLSLSVKPPPFSFPGQVSFPRRIKYRFSDPLSVERRFLRHTLVISCTLNPENVNSAVDSVNSSSDFSESLETNELDNGAVSTESVGGREVENGDVKKRLPIMVFLVGVFARLKNGIERILYSDWFSWWPFWRQEKRLERLIEEADANPMDAAKQSLLLSELNKHRLLFFCYQCSHLLAHYSLEIRALVYRVYINLFRSISS